MLISKHDQLIEVHQISANSFQVVQVGEVLFERNNIEDATETAKDLAEDIAKGYYKVIDGSVLAC